VIFLEIPWIMRGSAFLRGRKRRARRGNFGPSRRAPSTIGSPTTHSLFTMASDGLQGLEAIFLLLIEVACRWCGRTFYVCRRCWRGQAYCGEVCRRLGSQRAHREAQRRYRQTGKGKKAHRQGENRRRHGWSARDEKKMDDGTSRGASLPVIGFFERSWKRGHEAKRCHFCGCRGRVVDRFPRRA